MGKIKIIFTGGTIGSTLIEYGDGVIGTDKEKPRLLLAAYKQKFGADLTEMADISEPYTILSEHLDGQWLARLILEVQDAVSQGYDGILVTHGTDTLQYTGAALGYALGLCSTPVILVSANYPIEQGDSNGLDNLHGAVCWLLDCPKDAGGVWVSYRNQGEPLMIHRATRLLAHAAGEDRVESLAGKIYGSYNQDWSFRLNPAYCEREDEIKPLKLETNQHFTGLNPGILWLRPAPGMIYPRLSPEIRGIIHETYHSGTLNLEDDGFRRFLNEATARKVPVYLTGTSSGAVYESTRAFESFGLQCLPGRAPIAVYMKLWLTFWCGRNPSDTMAFALGGDC